MGDTLAPIASARTSPTSGPRDKFLLRFGVATLACALLLYVDDELNSIQIFRSYHLAIGLFLMAAVATYLVAAFLVGLFTLRWKILVSCLFGPLLVFLAFQYVLQAGVTAGYLHFLLKRGVYLSQISDPVDQSQQPHVWPWSKTGDEFAYHVWKTVVYDPTGEILFAPEQRSADWVREVQASAKAAGAVSPTWLRPINIDKDFFPRHVWIENYGRGFYLVTETCGWSL